MRAYWPVYSKGLSQCVDRLLASGLAFVRGSIPVGLQAHRLFLVRVQICSVEVLFFWRQ